MSNTEWNRDDITSYQVVELGEWLAETFPAMAEQLPMMPVEDIFREVDRNYEGGVEAWFADNRP